MSIGKPCREATCKAMIVFLPTKAGKKMPVNVESLSDEDVELLLRGDDDVLYRHGEHISHYSSCTEPRRFSKK